MACLLQVTESLVFLDIYHGCGLLQIIKEQGVQKIRKLSLSGGNANAVQ
jgi:hypothetical protein